MELEETHAEGQILEGTDTGLIKCKRRDLVQVEKGNCDLGDSPYLYLLDRVTNLTNPFLGLPSGLFCHLKERKETKDVKKGKRDF